MSLGLSAEARASPQFQAFLAQVRDELKDCHRQQTVVLTFSFTSDNGRTEQQSITIPGGGDRARSKAYRCRICRRYKDHKRGNGIGHLAFCPGGRRCTSLDLKGEHGSGDSVSLHLSNIPSDVRNFEEEKKNAAKKEGKNSIIKSISATAGGRSPLNINTATSAFNLACASAPGTRAERTKNNIELAILCVAAGLMKCGVPRARALRSAQESVSCSPVACALAREKAPLRRRKKKALATAPSVFQTPLAIAALPYPALCMTIQQAPENLAVLTLVIQHGKFADGTPLASEFPYLRDPNNSLDIINAEFTQSILKAETAAYDVARARVASVTSMTGMENLLGTFVSDVRTKVGARERRRAVEYCGAAPPRGGEAAAAASSSSSSSSSSPPPLPPSATAHETARDIGLLRAALAASKEFQARSEHELKEHKRQVAELIARSLAEQSGKEADMVREAEELKRALLSSKKMAEQDKRKQQAEAFRLRYAGFEVARDPADPARKTRWGVAAQMPQPASTSRSSFPPPPSLQQQQQPMGLAPKAFFKQQQVYKPTPAPNGGGGGGGFGDSHGGHRGRDRRGGGGGGGGGDSDRDRGFDRDVYHRHSRGGGSDRDRRHRRDRGFDRDVYNRRGRGGGNGGGGSGGGQPYAKRHRS